MEQVFWGVALFATLLQILFFTGSLFGFGADDSDLDHPGGGHGAGGLKLLSIRALLGFLTGFGWAGVLGLGAGMTLLMTSVMAVGTGIAFALLVAVMLKIVLSLGADGTVRLENAIGHQGQVYVTIPAERGGHGQVEIKLQSRLLTLPAITEHSTDLAPPTPIEVTGLEETGVLIVKPL